MVAVLALVLVAGAAAASAQPARATDHPLLQPIDAQSWMSHEDMTWEDYVPVRPDAWLDPANEGSEVQYSGAVILLDFEDQPFLITEEPESHVFGNPQPGHEPVAPEDVNQWMYDYLATPSEYNNGQSIHAYWMEDTHGRIGVSLTVFGPYTLPGKYHEYGLSGFGNNVSTSPTATESVCPATSETCNRSFRSNGEDLWEAAEGPDVADDFDFRFYVTAGHDETSTWQEFGEMIFAGPEEVPAAFGPPGAEDGPVLNHAGVPIPNYADTRYIEWTSWKAASNHWPSAGGGASGQAENSGQGVYAHEFSHIRGLPDNYNNPFADNIRNYTGHWEMMSRGSFNGPGGTHARWQVPNAGGSALGPHHMVHFKNRLGVLGDDEQVFVQRNDLADQGIAVVTLKAREYVPDGDAVGLTVVFGEGGDLAGTCANQGADPFYCTGSNWQNYTFEVVDRVGNDSFTPGHGVLLAKTRLSGNPNVWVIDARPEDIGMIDYYRPGTGEPVPVVRGDPRQLNDATFHAGTASGSEYEYVDSFNRLHFYVLDAYRDEEGVLFYDVAIRRFDGAGPFRRDVALGKPATIGRSPGFLASCSFPLTNSGEAGEGIFDSDVYRVSATSSSGNWELTLPNALAAAQAGETVEVPVHVLRRPGGAARTTVTLTATSETDPSRSATQTCNVHVKDTTPGGGQGN